MKTAQTQMSTIDNSSLVSVPFKSLVFSAYNVRKTMPEVKVQELASNIEAVGLLHNLVVYESKGKGKGKERSKKISYAVAAGQRRFCALAVLLHQGKITDDYLVPVKIVSEAEAAKISLIENEQRAQMHPFDQINAFSELHKNGHSVGQIADLFGYSTKHVDRTLKLATMSPVLIALLAEDKITLDQLRALSLSPDHDRQEQVWENACANSEWARSISNLRNAMAQDKVLLSKNFMAQYVGIETYEAAGGTVERDLFSEEENVYFSDLPLLEKLAEEKIKLYAEEIRQTEGWAFAVGHFTDISYSEKALTYQFVDAETRGFTNEETHRLQDIAERIDELEAEYYDDEAEHDSETADQLAKEIKQLNDEQYQINLSAEVWTDELKTQAGVYVTASFMIKKSK